MKSPIDLLRALFTDVKRLEPGARNLDRDLLTIETRFKDEGYGFLTVALPRFGAAFDRSLSQKRFACPLGFSKSKGSALPKLFSGLLCEVFDPSSGLLKDSPSKGMVEVLRQIFYIFKKVDLPAKSIDKLDNAAKVSFYETDVLARDVVLDNTASHLIRSVARLVLPDLHSLDPASLTYKHGPGAVREGVKSNQKWSTLFNVLSSEDNVHATVGWTNFLYSSGQLVIDRYGSWFNPTAACTPRCAFPRDSAKLISVPKNSTSRRTITIEPLLNQYVQQGLNTELRSCIDRCSVLSNSLTLTDQSKNQFLALEGSRTGEWDTLDLKSASDLLSLRLFESVFGDKVEFFKLALEFRSPMVESSLGKSQLFKYAGMGNATTFPVQSVTFAVVAYAAICAQLGRKPSVGLLRRVSRYVRIFGDDIIVKSPYTYQVVNWLHRVGLKVNVQKSYSEGNFRESCGMDAFMGNDVTPIYVQTRPEHPSTEPSDIESLVASSNHLWLRGYYQVSTCIKNEVEERLRRRLPLVSRTSSLLGWHTHQDLRDHHRWNRRLHRFETRSYVSIPRKQSDRLDGYGALVKFFHKVRKDFMIHLPESTDSEHLTTSQRRFNNRLTLRWVPSY